MRTHTVVTNVKAQQNLLAPETGMYKLPKLTILDWQTNSSVYVGFKNNIFICFQIELTTSTHDTCTSASTNLVIQCTSGDFSNMTGRWDNAWRPTELNSHVHSSIPGIYPMSKYQHICIPVLSSLIIPVHDNLNKPPSLHSLFTLTPYSKQSIQASE